MDIISANMTNTAQTNVMTTVSKSKIRLRYKNGFLQSSHSFISDHFTIYNRYYLLSLCKT